MRKNLSLIITLCLLFAVHPASYGAGNGDFHFGYISASAGYSSLSQNIKDVTTKGSWAAIVGAGYEFRMNNGWASAGVQLTRHQSTTTPNTYVFDSPIGGWDSEKDAIEFYRYTIHQIDKQTFHSVDIPFMAGYYNSGFYIGAGVKVGFSVASSITTSGSFDLGAKYKDGIGIVEHVGPYTTYSMDEKRYSCNLQTQCALIGEIGYDLLSSMMTNSTICHMLKIGIYAEYGLRNIRPLGSMDPIQLQGMNYEEAARTYGQVDATQGTITPYYLNTRTEGKRIAPYYVGVKLTYLIGSSWSASKTWHKGCQCYQ